MEPVIRIPRPLAPGDRVAVVAPASPFPEADVAAGLAWLGERYRVEPGDHLYERAGYLAGADGDRAGDLSRAMIDPGIRAIFCARGGYGILRIVDALPWADFARDPKWICGFSDVTALLAGALDHGVASLHVANLTGLGRGDATARDEALGVLDGSRRALAWNDLEIVHEARHTGEDRESREAEGVLFGGNIALLHALAAARRLVVPQGAILLLEDTTERPYRLDRMMTTLRLGGHLGRASAVVFGELTDCNPGVDGWTSERVLADCTRSLGVPVVRGAPFGHGAVNRPFVMGARARLEGTTLRSL